MLIRHTVCRFLEDHGLAVEAAVNGVEALQMLERISPDFIITDLQMPRMGGRELIAALKANPATAGIPIIVLAGRTSNMEGQPMTSVRVIYKDIDINDQLEKVLSDLQVPQANQASAGD